MEVGKVLPEENAHVVAQDLISLDVTLPTPAANLAWEEILAETCEGGGPAVLRFWTPREVFVVVGYGNHVEQEVKVEVCRADGVPIFRRISGGGTVLQMPGCLNYALVLRVPDKGPLATITGANRFIMQRHAAVLSRLTGRSVEVQGITDLAVAGRKCSGNAQRRGRQTMLFHGVFLLEAVVELMERYLHLPSKQPEYRAHRCHADFVINLKVPEHQVKEALCQAWGAQPAHPAIPRERLKQLVEDKYGREEWNYRF